MRKIDWIVEKFNWWFVVYFSCVVTSLSSSPSSAFPWLPKALFSLSCLHQQDMLGERATTLNVLHNKNHKTEFYVTQCQKLHWAAEVALPELLCVCDLVSFWVLRELRWRVTFKIPFIKVFPLVLLNVVKEYYLNVLSTHEEQQRSREEWKTSVDAGNNLDYLFFWSAFY